MNRRFLLLISFFIAIATTTISYVIAPQEIKSQTDFVLSDLGVENSTTLIFNTGLILSGILAFLSLNLKSKKDLFLIPTCLGLILIAVFNKEDYSFIHWIGAAMLFLGFPIYFFFFQAKTKILKLLPPINIILLISLWLISAANKFEAQIVNIIFITFYIIHINFSKNENNRS